MTNETRSDQDVVDSPSHYERRKSVSRLWLQFVSFTAILIVSGLVLKYSSVDLAKRLGLSHLFLGSLITAFVTSLPELTTTIAAVRIGAVTLAVGGIIGGNSFDVLFLVFSDVAYRDGSIYQAFTQEHCFIILLSIAMTATLLMGLLRRERFGIGRIGTESFMLIVIYVIGIILTLQYR